MLFILQSRGKKKDSFRVRSSKRSLSRIVAQKLPEAGFFEAPLFFFEEQYSHSCPANVFLLAVTEAIMPQPENISTVGLQKSMLTTKLKAYIVPIGKNNERKKYDSFAVQATTH